ncbi:hypothetical protein [Microvirga splendida]|uniref:Invasion associated locus B family protein n=1 Tax=Microvirga splendida TaxID=2795727 RepID=A0ABS0Y2S4_9HYPH|nr:hypothetical protein [Microvirga splendida]MBJ6126611.1 hypothetical protein [Microvirga splendida]
MKVFLCLAAMFLGVAAARGADFQPDQPVWSMCADKEQAFIAYAVPESDVGLMWIYCARKSGRITVVPDLSTSTLNEGDALTVTLASDGGHTRLMAKASRNRFGDLQISGLLQEPKHLLQLFSKGRTLKVSLSGNSVVMPLNRQAHRVFAIFRKSCPSLR